MELRLLRYFLAASHEGTITRAAQTLHIAQPSLSKQLMELENALGKKLFVRSNKKLTLTEEGLLLQKRAEEILSLCEKTEQEIMQDNAFISGEISIGGSTSPTVINAIARLQTKYPNIRFNITNGSADKISEYIRHGSLDFAVLFEPIDITIYNRLSLNEESEWGLLMDKNSPLAAKSVITPEDVTNIPIIMHRRLTLQRTILEWYGVKSQPMNIAGIYDILFGMPLFMIKNNLGYAFTTKNQIEPISNSLCFRPLCPAIKTQQSLVWKRHTVFSKAAQKFIEEIHNFNNTDNI